MTIAQEEILGPVLVVIPSTTTPCGSPPTRSAGLSGAVCSGSLERSLAVAAAFAPAT